MKAKNFRIGNIVDLWGSVAYIQRCDFSESEHGIAVDEAKPIKLTESWLRKLGFEGNDMDMWIVLPTGNELELHIDCVREGQFENACLTQGRQETGIPGKDYKFAYLNDCKNVHELQNLFFALTGTELEVNV